MTNDDKILKLWEYEKQLIDILQALDQNKTIKEGEKKKFNVDGFGESEDKNHTHLKNIKPMFLPFEQTYTQTPVSQTRNNKFQGGSLMARIDYLESLSNQDEKNKKKILTFEENSIELDEIMNMLQRGTEPSLKQSPAVHKTQNISCVANSVSDIERQASSLSNKILELRTELGLSWLCDKLTICDINKKMGGDGYFTNSDGEQEKMPDIPAGKNCPHRKYAGILRCVVCPANYSESPERLNNWLDYTKKKQKENKNQE